MCNNCKCKDDKVVLKYECEYEISKSSEDSGFDVRCIEDINIKPMEVKMIDLGIKLEIPKGYEVQLRPRSGLSAKGLLIQFGTIDEGYRGEVKAVGINLSGSEMIFSKGERVGQLVVSKIPSVEAVRIESVSKDTDRSDNGFGSSGML